MDARDRPLQSESMRVRLRAIGDAACDMDYSRWDRPRARATSDASRE